MKNSVLNPLLRDRVIPLTLLLAVLGGLGGCANIDRFGGKMDMAVGRLSEPSKPEYEGQLRAIEKVGALIAMEFEDGKMYDVVYASPGLLAGDTVRVYKVKNGYEARLWASAPPVTF